MREWPTHPEEVPYLAFSGDGKHLAAYGSALAVYNLETGKRVSTISSWPMVLDGWSSEGLGGLVVVVQQSSTVAVWNTAAWDTLQAPPRFLRVWNARECYGSL